MDILEQFRDEISRIDYSSLDKENIDKNKLAEVAKSLPTDNVDDHPYNFRKFFTYNI